MCHRNLYLVILGMLPFSSSKTASSPEYQMTNHFAGSLYCELSCFSLLHLTWTGEISFRHQENSQHSTEGEELNVTRIKIFISGYPIYLQPRSSEISLGHLLHSFPMLFFHLPLPSIFFLYTMSGAAASAIKSQQHRHQLDNWTAHLQFIHSLTYVHTYTIFPSFVQKSLNCSLVVLLAVHNNKTTNDEKYYSFSWPASRSPNGPVC